MEIVLFAGSILHVVDGLMLWRQNRAARPVDYAFAKHNANSKWYSRSMGILGTLITPVPHHPPVAFLGTQPQHCG